MELDPALPTVYCQRAEINQVILNALVNSAEAIGKVIGEQARRRLNHRPPRVVIRTNSGTLYQCPRIGQFPCSFSVWIQGESQFGSG